MAPLNGNVAIDGSNDEICDVFTEESDEDMQEKDFSDLIESNHLEIVNTIDVQRHFLFRYLEHFLLLSQKHKTK